MNQSSCDFVGFKIFNRISHVFTLANVRGKNKYYGNVEMLCFKSSMYKIGSMFEVVKFNHVFLI